PSPIPPTKTPRRTPTPTLSPTPSPTPLPVLSPSMFSSADMAQMMVWQAIDSQPEFTLYRLSQTPLGVVDLEWSPDGRHLWLGLASGYTLMGGATWPIPIVVNRDSHAAWNPNIYGDTWCYKAHDWSPDGRQVVFVRDWHLWLADADRQDTRPIPLPPDTESLRSPLYSPDGRLIAALGSRVADGQAFYDLWLLDPAGSAPLRLIENAGFGAFAWSPAGDALAHLGQAEDESLGLARLWLAEVGSGRTVYADLGPLPGTEGCLSAPFWVMDGDKALATVLQRPGVWLVDRQGQTQWLDEERLALPPDKDCGSADVSPDGRYAVLCSGLAMSLVDLTTGDKPPIALNEACYTRSRIAWSPTSTHFACWDGYGGGLAMVEAADGTAQVVAADGSWPGWSPDGRHLAYWRQNHNGYSLWLLDLDDRATIRLTAPSPDNPLQQIQIPQGWTVYPYDITPRWLPDGTAVAFVSRQDEFPEAYLLQLPQ
ncbi:MAG: hypothetical protein AB1791_21065, partial [Chloroflexota bacterium]